MAYDRYDFLGVTRYRLAGDDRYYYCTEPDGSVFQMERPINDSYGWYENMPIRDR